MPLELVVNDVNSMLAIGFVAGLGASLHCLAMCGPLALAAVGGQGWKGTSAAWHAGRLVAYASVGAVLGGSGDVAAHWLEPIRPALPWVMVAGLLMTAFGVGRHGWGLPGGQKVAAALTRLGAKFSPPIRAYAIGAATPFLPCGVLYGMYVSAASAGSWQGGAALMGGFAVAAVPLFGVVQWQRQHLALTGRFAGLGRTVFPVVAAAVVAWRAIKTGEIEQAPHCH